MTHENQYRRPLLMMALSFVAMYLLMYTMVDKLGNVYNNFNQFYMAGLMTMPMLLLELLFMGSMYPNKRLNWAIVAVSLIVGLPFSQQSGCKLRSRTSNS